MQKLVMTGGGSAGHTVPNLALLPALKEKFDISYVGSEGIEKKLLSGQGVPFYTISCTKLVRGSLLQNIQMPLRFIKSIRQAKRVLRSIRPDAVFSKGGYVSLPVVFAAKALKIPVVSHESDLSAGLANRLIAKKCDLVLTSFPETAKQFKNGVYSGSPVRQELFQGSREIALHKYGFDGRKPVLLIFGGGSGSRTINRAVAEILPELLKKMDVLHICGKDASTKVLPGYAPLAYEQDMASAYACADFVVSRAGSNSVFEILALQKPALLIPLENKRSRGDQVENALYFSKKGCCRVLREGDLCGEALLSALQSLAADKALLKTLKGTKIPCGNQNIVAAIETAAEKKAPKLKTTQRAGKTF